MYTDSFFWKLQIMHNIKNIKVQSDLDDLLLLYLLLDWLTHIRLVKFRRDSQFCVIKTWTLNAFSC